MLPTIGFSFGDVVLVPFPFTDQTAAKKRPAIVVSSDAYNRERPDVIVVAVTSQTARPAGSIGALAIDEWREAGLLKVSLVKPVFATLEQNLVLKKLGSLQPKDRAALRGVLQLVLG